MSESKSRFVALKNTIDAKFTGIFGFWHNWFSKGKYAMMLLNMVETFPSSIKRFVERNANKSEVSDFKSYDDLKSYCSIVIKPFNMQADYQDEVAKENSRYETEKSEERKVLSVFTSRFPLLQNEYNAINEQAQHDIINSCKDWISKISLPLLDNVIKCNLKSEEALGKISCYKLFFPDKIPYRDYDYSNFISDAESFLDVFGVCSVTSLSTKSAFPLSSELFDMLVIDEASQCDVASAIPLIMRAKQLVVIGDPMQLRHITSVQVKEEDAVRKYLNLGASPYLKYVESSLWDYTNNFISKASDKADHNIMLESHFRCHPDIIGYSNVMFYKKKLGKSLTIKTDVSRLKWKQHGIYLVDVKGSLDSYIDEKGNTVYKNINQEEVNKSIKLAIKLADMDNDVSIGIITPFKDQAEALNRAIPEDYRNRIDASTVHKYQGDERDVIVYSLVVTYYEYDEGRNKGRKIGWIDKKEPNLINVAVTRARSALYVVCDRDYIEKNSKENEPLGYLVKIAKKK